MSTVSKIGKRGTIVIPALLRRHFGLEEGSLIITEKIEGAYSLDLQLRYHTDERKAEFLLSNAVDEDDYNEPLHCKFPNNITLPEKDRPVLLSAIFCKATHLLTGDYQHFGKYYGNKIAGILILPPSEYLKK